VVNTHITIASEDAALQILLFNPSRHGVLVLPDLSGVNILNKESLSLSLSEAQVISLLEDLVVVDGNLWLTKSGIVSERAESLRELPILVSLAD